jgi:LacI family transcriptional regulator
MKKTRERVEKVIRDLGYVPNPQARALALRRNFLVGLIHDNPNAQMVLNMQQGILEALNGTDFEMLIRPVDRTSPMMLERRSKISRAAAAVRRGDLAAHQRE